MIIFLLLVVATALNGSQTVPVQEKPGATPACTPWYLPPVTEADQKISAEEIKEAIRVLNKYCPREYLEIFKGEDPCTYYEPSNALSKHVPLYGDSAEGMRIFAFQYALKHLKGRSIKKQPLNVGSIIREPKRLQNRAENLPFSELMNSEKLEYLSPNLYAKGWVHPEVVKGLLPVEAQYVLVWLSNYPPFRTTIYLPKQAASVRKPKQGSALASK